MAFKLAALLFFSAQLCAAKTLAPCVCARNLTPVCGSDGNTYNNQCLLDCAAHTSGTTIATVKYGPCEATPPEQENCICSHIFHPVCATDGQTYQSECALNCQKARYNPGLSVKHSGACTTPQEPSCTCPAIYSPVCGSDGNTYSNDCALNCATKDNNMLRVAHQGACENKVKVVDFPTSSLARTG